MKITHNPLSRKKKPDISSISFLGLSIRVKFGEDVRVSMCNFNKVLYSLTSSRLTPAPRHNQVLLQHRAPYTATPKSALSILHRSDSFQCYGKSLVTRRLHVWPVIFWDKHLDAESADRLAHTAFGFRVRPPSLPGPGRVRHGCERPSFRGRGVNSASRRGQRRKAKA